MNTEYRSAGIYPRQVDKAPGADFIVAECVFVSSQGAIVVDAGGKISEVSWRQCGTGQGLETPHVQNVFYVGWYDLRTARNTRRGRRPSVQPRGPGGERQHRCAQDKAAPGYGTTKSLSFVLVRHALFCQEDPPDRHSDNGVKAIDPDIAYFFP